MLNSNVQSSAANATRVPVVVISTQEKGTTGDGARLSTHTYPYASGPPLSAAAGGITSDVAARRRATAQHRTAPPPRGFKPDFPLCACIASPKNPLVPGGAQTGVVSGLGAELRAHEDWTRKYLHLSLSFTTDQRPEVRRGRNGGRRPERSFQDYVQLLGRGTADPGGTAMSGRSVTILLVVWLAWASLLVPSTEALPKHVVAGGLFGPGGRVDPGALNPANSAGLVLYSTSQPSHSLVVGGDAFTAADGTNPAFWAADVGSPWNWMDGDIVVGVLETVRGLGGWTDVNYTASIQGILRTGPTVQDFGNGTLEALPPVSVSAGANSVDVSWPSLSDPNGNVASYELYHAVSPAGPFSTVARVGQGAFPAHNHTGLGPGIHCYNLAVNYRRDGAGAVYTTTGRSEIECVTIADVSPRILATDPQAGQANVSPAAPVVVTFSEAMDVATVTWSIGPSVVLVPVWSAGDSVLTLNHTNPFSDCFSYTLAITAGRDQIGRAARRGRGEIS